MKCLGSNDPAMQVFATDTEGILEGLMGAGTVAIEGDGEGGNAKLGRGELKIENRKLKFMILDQVFINRLQIIDSRLSTLHYRLSTRLR
jgi:hypothetical protein